jgi:hypothetical protein
MGIYYSNCREKQKDDDLDLVEPISEEIQFPLYYSKSDSIFNSIKELNLFEHITLIEYINLLSNINLENSDAFFDGPFKINFSYYDSQNFINSYVSDELYNNFINKRILSQRKLDENETIFRDMCLEIYNILKKKLKEHYQNEEAQITKKDLISLGIFFCKGTNAYKMKLIFDLFKNNKGYLEQNKFFDEFLLCNFLIGSYILIQAKNNLSRNNPLIAEIPLGEIEKYMEIYDLNGCENLVKEFNSCFFNGMKLTFYEYKRNFKDSNGFGWIFFPEGIRQKLEENKFI